MAMRFIEKNFLAFMAGLLLIIGAANLVMLRVGILGIIDMIVIDVAAIGAILVAYGAKIAHPRDKAYYVVWGLLLILAAATAATMIYTGDMVLAAAVGLGGLGAIILLVALKM